MGCNLLYTSSSSCTAHVFFDFGVVIDLLRLCLFLGQVVDLVPPLNQSLTLGVTLFSVSVKFLTFDLLEISPLPFVTVTGVSSACALKRRDFAFSSEYVGALQYCAKVTQANFDEFLGFSWLFKEISLQSKFP